MKLSKTSSVTLSMLIDGGTTVYCPMKLVVLMLMVSKNYLSKMSLLTSGFLVYMSRSSNCFRSHVK